MSSDLKFNQFQLSCQGVTLPFGLVVDEISVRATEPVVNLDNGKIAAIGAQDAFAIVSEASIASYLRPQLPSAVKEADVYIGDGLLKIAAKVVVVFPISVNAYCRLEIVDESRLEIRLHDVEPGGPVRGMLEKYIDDVNPILQASDLPIALRFTDVQLADGQVRLQAELLASG
ncbi:MAG: LmeA family phospholipid-binding protein [Chthonomonas sp.]|nr:LmeA family phospholipid-binding protein [Chthonomonas sp.]